MSSPSDIDIDIDREPNKIAKNGVSTRDPWCQSDACYICNNLGGIGRCNNLDGNQANVVCVDNTVSDDPTNCVNYRGCEINYQPTLASFQDPSDLFGTIRLDSLECEACPYMAEKNPGNTHCITSWCQSDGCA